MTDKPDSNRWCVCSVQAVRLSDLTTQPYPPRWYEVPASAKGVMACSVARKQVDPLTSLGPRGNSSLYS